MVLQRRAGFTLLELLVVIAIGAVVLGVVLPAVQQARATAARAKCQNNLRQIGQAAHRYHDDHQTLPSGVRYENGKASMYLSGWQLHLLPYTEQSALWPEAVAAYEASHNPFKNPPHSGLGTVVRIYVCPSEPRASAPQFSPVVNTEVAFTCYLGVEGLDVAKQDGLLFRDSRVRIGEIRDGASNTLLAGERPPSPDFEWGWWYAGVGQEYTGSIDMLLGVAERNVFVTATYPCPPGPYTYSKGNVDDPCAVFHFWSQHPGGSNFLFADGAVHFLRYSAAPLLPALASRAGGETVELFD